MRLPQALQDVSKVLVAFMLTALFIGWGVLGPAQISKQNTVILQGVRHELVAQQQAQAERSATFLRAFLAQTKQTHDNTAAIVCILEIHPDERTDKAVDTCLTRYGVHP